jgi:membrane-associated phospholipid phosphatase
MVELVGAAALALWLAWLGASWFPRAAPLTEAATLPVGADWLTELASRSSFPDGYALLAAALAGVLAGASRRSAVPAQLVAVGAALASLYFGLAWLTDALAGYLLGNVAAVLSRYAVAQVFASTEAAAVPARDVGTEHEPRRAAPGARETVG